MSFALQPEVRPNFKSGTHNICFNAKLSDHQFRKFLAKFIRRSTHVRNLQEHSRSLGHLRGTGFPACAITGLKKHLENTFKESNRVTVTKKIDLRISTSRSSRIYKKHDVKKHNKSDFFHFFGATALKFKIIRNSQVNLRLLCCSLSSSKN